MPIDVIQEEKTTLPEGATVSLLKCKSTGKQRTAFYTELRARVGEKVIKMRVDDTGPVNMRQYLDLVVREIARQRSFLKEKPTWAYDIKTPYSIAVFTQSMAYNGMFMFEPILSPEQQEIVNNGKQRKRKPRATESGGHKGVQETDSGTPF